MGNYITELRLKRELPKNTYLSKIPAIKTLISGEIIKFEKSVTFFVGENGTGKSTILESLAVHNGFNAEGGSKNFNFSTRETNYELSDYLTVVKKAYPKDGYFLRAESFYNVASNIEELGVTGYGDNSLHEQSHGESFLSLFKNRFRGNGLYILDEPESALSPMKQLTLLSLLHVLAEEENSQLIISTHSPILLAYPNADIFELSTSGIKKVKYEETEIYTLYKEFLKAPERMLKYLWD